MQPCGTPGFLVLVAVGVYSDGHVAGSLLGSLGFIGWVTRGTSGDEGTSQGVGESGYINDVGAVW